MFFSIGKILLTFCIRRQTANVMGFIHIVQGHREVLFAPNRQKTECVQDDTMLV